jgi:hypothetical protein
MSDTRRCPACRIRVAPTVKGNIEWHTDTAGKQCDASGEPFRIALKSRPSGPPKGRQLRTGSVVAAVAANHERHVNGARRQVTAARAALRALSMNQPRNPFTRRQHVLYEEVLTARLLNPRATLSEIADQLGMSKDTYSGRLRRALAHAQRLQEKAA